MTAFNINDLSPYLEGVFQSALLQDWNQTSVGMQNQYKEQNPILGERPSQGKVNAYMASIGALQYGGYKLLPDKYKLPYTLGSALIEGNVINKNRQNNKGQGINTPLLGLGALATYALQNDWAKKHKASIGVNKTYNTLVPTFNMEF